MRDSSVIITISDVIEYLFCPRFIYFIYCLGIPQHEEKRFKVLRGRDVHEIRRITNTSYMRKKLGCISKERNVFVASKVNHIKGIVDEVLFLEDGTAAPLEYKFAEYKDKIYMTHKYQLYLQALMISENYDVEINKAYICYTRSNNMVKSIKIEPEDVDEAIKVAKKTIDIIEKGVYPKATKYKSKCIDCCYRNICV